MLSKVNSLTLIYIPNSLVVHPLVQKRRVTREVYSKEAIWVVR